MTWKNVEVEISKLNRECKVINTKVGDLIDQNQSEMIKIIHEHITEKNTKMHEKAEKYIKSL